MNWLIYQVVAALIGAGNTILDKKLATRPNTPPLLHAISFGLVGLPVALIGLVWLPPLPWTAALVGLIAGVIFVVAARLYYGAMAQVEASQVTLLMRLTSVQTLLLSAIFLGERLTPVQYGAFGVMLVGSLLLTTRPGQVGLRLDKSIGLIMLATCLLALQNVLLVPIYREYSLWAGVVWENAGQVLGTLALIGFACDKRRLWRAARLGGWPLWGTLTGEQTIRLVIGILDGVVLAQGVSLALTSVLGGLRPMFTLLLAIWLLQERWPRGVLPARLSGIGCIGLGLILMSLK